MKVLKRICGFTAQGISLASSGPRQAVRSVISKEPIFAQWPQLFARRPRAVATDHRVLLLGLTRAVLTSSERLR